MVRVCASTAMKGVEKVASTTLSSTPIHRIMAINSELGSSNDAFNSPMHGHEHLLWLFRVAPTPDA